MLKTALILLFGTGYFIGVLCSDDITNDYSSSSSSDENSDYYYCDETEYGGYVSKPACSPIEEYSDCVNGGCDRRKCIDLKRPQICIDPAQGYCVKGCVCTKGYLRNNEGNCVPIDSCPEKNNTNCGGLNEYYENCEATSEATKTYPCNVGCQCVIGYIRNNVRKCVPNTGQFTTTTPKTTTTTLMPNNNNSSQNALDKLWQANAKFTAEFMKIKILENSQESFVVSPFSVLPPLGQITPFAKGMTYEELLKFLNLNSRDEIPGAFRSLFDDLNSPKNVTLLLGQKVYANKQFELNPKFVNDSKYNFDSVPENIDFSRNQEAAAKINKWVEKQTNGLIPTLIDASALSALTRLVLVNAIYFKGNWLRPFNPKSTQKRDFYMTENKTVSVNMMYQKGTFGYTENDQYKALQLFYKDKNYSLLTVLPTSKGNNSIKSLVNLLDDSNVIIKIINNLRSETVRVYLPSIHTSTKTDLKKNLLQVNVTTVFNSQKADISDLLKKFQQLYISEFFQKADIVINELGSEAAAANAAIVSATAAMISEPKIFEADRPFMFYILYQKKVLFCGVYTGT